MSESSGQPSIIAGQLNRIVIALESIATALEVLAAEVDERRALKAAALETETQRREADKLRAGYWGRGS